MHVVIILSFNPYGVMIINLSEMDSDLELSDRQYNFIWLIIKCSFFFCSFSDSCIGPIDLWTVNNKPEDSSRYVLCLKCFCCSSVCVINRANETRSFPRVLSKIH